MKRRVIAVLLSAAMALSALPLPAFAAEDADVIVMEETDVATGEDAEAPAPSVEVTDAAEVSIDSVEETIDPAAADEAQAEPNAVAVPVDEELAEEEEIAEDTIEAEEGQTEGSEVDAYQAQEKYLTHIYFGAENDPSYDVKKYATDGNDGTINVYDAGEDASVVKVDLEYDPIKANTPDGIIPELHIWYNDPDNDNDLWPYDSETELEPGKDYEIILANNKNVRDDSKDKSFAPKIEISFKKSAIYNKLNPITLYFDIHPKTLNPETMPGQILQDGNLAIVHSSKTSFDYNGKKQGLDFTSVKYVDAWTTDDKGNYVPVVGQTVDLREGVDYQIIRPDEVRADDNDKRYRIKGIGNYTCDDEQWIAQYKINRKEIAKGDIKVDNDPLYFFTDAGESLFNDSYVGNFERVVKANILDANWDWSGEWNKDRTPLGNGFVFNFNHADGQANTNVPKENFKIRFYKDGSNVALTMADLNKSMQDQKLNVAAEYRYQVYVEAQKGETVELLNNYKYTEPLQDHRTEWVAAEGRFLVVDKTNLGTIWKQIKGNVKINGDIVDGIEDNRAKFTYDGTNKLHDLSAAIKEAFEIYQGGYSKDIVITCDGPEGKIIDRGKYTVTISGNAWGRFETDDPVQIEVEVRPKQMNATPAGTPNLIVDPNPNPTPTIGFDLDVFQRFYWQNNQTIDQGDPEVTLVDCEIAGESDEGKKVLNQGSDYTVRTELKFEPSGAPYVNVTLEANESGNYTCTDANGNPVSIVIKRYVNKVTDISDGSYSDWVNTAITEEVAQGKQLIYKKGEPVEVTIDMIKLYETIPGAENQPQEIPNTVNGVKQWYVTGDDGCDIGKYINHQSAGDHYVIVEGTNRAPNYVVGKRIVKFKIEGVDLSYDFAVDETVKPASAVAKTEITDYESLLPKVVEKGNKNIEVEPKYFIYTYKYVKDEGDEKEVADVVIKYDPTLDPPRWTMSANYQDAIEFVQAGDYTIEITPNPATVDNEMELYSGKITAGYTFKVDPKLFADSQAARPVEGATITIAGFNEVDITWPGHVIKPEDVVKAVGGNYTAGDAGSIVVMDGNNVLELGKDYDIEVTEGSVADKVNENDGVLTFKGINNYKGSFTKTFDVEKARLKSVSVATDKQVYCGDIYNMLKSSDVTVKANNELANPIEYTVDPSEYTVKCTKSTNDKYAIPGETQIRVKAIAVKDGHYEDGSNVTYTFTIRKADIGRSDIFEVTGVEDKVFYGEDSEVVFEDLKLIDTRINAEVKAVEGEVTNYEVSYEGNNKPGKAKVTLSVPEENAYYTGKRVVEFELKKPEIASVEFVGLTDNSVVYNGKEQKPEIKVMDNSVPAKEIKSENFVVSYQNNVNVGTATVVVTSKEDGFCQGTKSADFTITKAKNNVTASIDKETIKEGDYATIKATADFGKLEYSSSDDAVATVNEHGVVTGVKAGTATITVSVANTDNYDGASTTVSVKVEEKQTEPQPGEQEPGGQQPGGQQPSEPQQTVPTTKDLAKLTAPTLSMTDPAYTGTAIMPKVTLKDGDKVLVEGTDYTLGYLNNTDAGTATVVVSGKGSYSGVINVPFTIKKAANVITVASTAINQANTKTRDRVFMLNVTATNPEAVTYSSDNPKIYVEPTTGLVTVMKGYIGGATITVSAAATANFEAAAPKTVTVTVTPQGTKIKKASASAKNGKITVKWSKKTVGDGYKIQYSTDPEFKTNVKYKLVKNMSKTSGTFKSKLSLKKGTKLYVRMLVYKKVNGTTYKSPVTSTKTVVVK